MANKQSFKTQLALAQDMVQSLYNRYNEVEYVDGRIKDLLQMLEEVGMFYEIIETLGEIYQNNFFPLKEELTTGILSDIKYVQEQEEGLESII